MNLLVVAAAASSVPQEHIGQATFAGGCFWCLEAAFEHSPGIISATPGYTGGTSAHPTYADYAAGGHVEAVRVEYDTRVTTYANLLETFFRAVDPTDSKGQFLDRGRQYRPVVYWETGDERLTAEEAIRRVGAAKIFQKGLAVEVAEAGPFHAAEREHHDYARRNQKKYGAYRAQSGRDHFLAAVWGLGGRAGGAEARSRVLKKAPRDARQVADRMSKVYTRPKSVAEVRQRLDDLAFQVTQEDRTEPPNAPGGLADEMRPGLYVDVVTGEPLFASQDKFVSSSGWPAFTRPLHPLAVVEVPQYSVWLGWRSEVRSAIGDSHLGHVFNDGPPPSHHRYCVNSAALRFVPAAEAARDPTLREFAAMAVASAVPKAPSPDAPKVEAAQEL